MRTLWQMIFNSGDVIFCTTLREVENLIAYAGPILDYTVELVFLSYDPDATMCQDDYEYYTRTWQYAGLPF